ncbi:MAG TPA: hypothetical protein VFV07_08805 [Rhizomicrobium sp.]|nr:hypothetical protein [Rhizomicrobium sp.]
MLSSLANLADRNFIIGYLLPVVFAVLASLLLLRDLPAFAPVWDSIVDVDKFASLTLLTIGIWGAASLLFSMSVQVHRLFEGYAGPLKAERWRRIQLAQFEKARNELKQLREAAKGDASFPSTAGARYLRALWMFRQRFPSRPEFVLPTRFGNVVRAFETYPYELYGADSVAVWPRLTAVVPDTCQARIEAAKAEVDCFLNASLLATLVALFCAVRGVLTLSDHYWNDADISWSFLYGGMFAVLLAVFAYKAAVIRARSWGVLVASAFDLYLPALAALLGHAVPDSLQERREFWAAFNEMFLYYEIVDPKRWPVVTAPAKEREPH